MTVTKLVERKLLDVVTIDTGSDIPKRKRFGQELLALATERGCLSEDAPLHPLMQWFLKIPRNFSHHQFTDFPFLTLVTFITTANFALNEIEQLSPSQEVDGSSRLLRYDSQREKLKLSVSGLQKGGHDFTYAKVEAYVTFPTGQVKTIQLKELGKGMWEGEYDTRHDPSGKFRVRLRCCATDGTRFRIPCDFTYTRFKRARPP